MTKPWKKRIRITLLVLLALIIAGGVWGFLIEPNRLIVRQETIAIGNWPKELSGLRIAVISDLHAGSPFINEAKLQRLVLETNQTKPDLIVLLGDFMIKDRFYKQPIAPERTAEILKGLSAPLGVFAVMGNHDWWSQADVRKSFELNGIRILENDVGEIRWRGSSFWLAGLADLWTQPQHVDETIAKTPPGSPVIAMTHNPDIFPNLPQSVPLLLAGHTHGGQVNLPLLGRLIVPSRFGQRYAAGAVFENGHHLFVTTGVGTSILPIRFRVPPEIVILTISSV
ncbi:MAG: metallophosphoesterase [Acidobacteriota bacterium]